MGILDSIGSAISNLIGGSSTPSAKPTMSMNQALDFMKQRGWREVGASPSPSPTSAGGFRYQMGKSDYSSLKPQVASVLKGTPLEGNTDDFIQAANKHGVDPRVLPTIAFNESSMGRNYPLDSFNPFGYNAGGGGTIVGKDGKTYVNVDQGLKNAGFISLPHAIDALTGRFAKQPTQAYKQFYQDPSVDNLQSAYNANPAEKANYLKNSQAIVSQFQ